jgi:hypothetical protein
MIPYILIVLIFVLFCVKKYYKKNSEYPNLKKMVHNLTKYNELSKQEENPIKALILSSFSVGYVKTLKDFDIEKQVNGFNQLQQDVIETHNNIAENVFKIVGTGDGN